MPDVLQLMTQPEKDFCFCTLALGSRYRLMAKKLAEDLEKYSPGTVLVIYTDQLRDFRKHRNVKAFKHNQQSTLRCVNDKRFLLQKALSEYRVAIHIDADTRILANIPEQIKWPSGITACHENLLKHLQKNCPEYSAEFKNVASKLEISEKTLKNAEWMGESIYAIARDEGKEKEFFKNWEIIVNYMELKGLHPNDGNIMALAAAKVGWQVHNEGWEELKQATKHFDASFNKPPQTFWETLKNKISYRYRFYRLCLMTLKSFEFYYR